jgi:hypothetical protein
VVPPDQAQALEVLSEDTNFSVVRMPGRRFPASVVQGDALHSVYTDLRSLEQHLRATLGEPHPLVDEVAAIADGLHERLWWYEQDLMRAGFSQLPYLASVGRPGDGSKG